tara:strand:+ start:1332 stop:1697 length:366 start_codon:yes stop_codon:yes gene_type:complete
MEDSYLEIRDIKIWARVGVLMEERKFGQLFSLDVSIWSDFSSCSIKDDLNLTIDYAVLIKDIKAHSMNFSCFTIEKYSSEILKIIVDKFDPLHIKIKLTKCKPPITGFTGEVSIIRFFHKE